MKKNIKFQVIALVVFSLISITSKAQIGINTATPDASAVLDLSKATKGMVIPWVTTIPSTPKTGTLIFDATTSATPNFKYYNGSWITLSGNGSVNLTIQNSLTEIAGGIAITAGTTSDDVKSPKGALDLQSNNKALVLPQFASPQTKLVNPSAGTIVYDTTDKVVMMFTGTAWEYYK